MEPDLPPGVGLRGELADPIALRGGNRLLKAEEERLDQVPYDGRLRPHGKVERLDGDRRRFCDRGHRGSRIATLQEQPPRSSQNGSTRLAGCSLATAGIVPAPARRLDESAQGK